MDPFRPSQGYRQLDHTGALALEFWAPTEEALLMIGGQALIEIMTGSTTVERANGFDADEQRHVIIDAVDPTDRMIRWLNEVVVAAHSGCVMTGADLALSDSGLQGTIYGDDEEVETELASVTPQDAELAQHDYGWYGRIVVDV